MSCGDRNIYKNGMYLSLNPTWHAEDSAWKARLIYDFLQQSNIEFRSVCDVGCGIGGVLQELCNKMDEKIMFYGYEISPQAYEMCKAKENARLRFFLGDFAEKDILYDLILIIDVIEHVQDYLNFLKKVKTKGVFKLFKVPLELSAVAVILKSRRLLLSRKSAGHLHYFTKDLFLEILKDSGYEVISFRVFKKSGQHANIHFKSIVDKLLFNSVSLIDTELAVSLFGGMLLVLAR